jgi:hypothetical protein
MCTSYSKITLYIIVRQTSSILLQGVPNSVPLNDVNEALLKVKF